ncbi:phytoene dehydrogenase [Mycobacteroides abscessus subsp. abscessus]|nr:phytoene dehydrogenase [Mycobacteroides abscessus subsp. abscessus]
MTLFDLSPTQVADILRDHLPTSVARGLSRFRYGPGAFKVDFAIEDGVALPPASVTGSWRPPCVLPPT